MPEDTREAITTPESPTAKRMKTLDPRLSGTEAEISAPIAVPSGRPLFAADDDPAAVRTDQGHRQLDPDASPMELAVSFRQMAFENATLAASCLEERRRTNDELQKISAQLTLQATPTPMHTNPSGYRVLVTTVALLAGAHVVEFMAILRILRALHSMP